LVLQSVWGLALVALGMFLLLCQRRGAALVLLISVLAMPIWC